MSKDNKITRREFLSYSALAGVAGAMGLSPFLFLLAAADTVSKLAALTLWIAVLAGTAGYLIRLVYRHERRKKTV